MHRYRIPKCAHLLFQLWPTKKSYISLTYFNTTQNKAISKSEQPRGLFPNFQKPLFLRHHASVFPPKMWLLPQNHLKRLHYPDPFAISFHYNNKDTVVRTRTGHRKKEKIWVQRLVLRYIRKKQINDLSSLSLLCHCYFVLSLHLSCFCLYFFCYNFLSCFLLVGHFCHLFFLLFYYNFFCQFVK